MSATSRVGPAVTSAPLPSAYAVRRTSQAAITPAGSWATASVTTSASRPQVTEYGCSCTSVATKGRSVSEPRRSSTRREPCAAYTRSWKPPRGWLARVTTSSARRPGTLTPYPLVAGGPSGAEVADHIRDPDEARGPPQPADSTTASAVPSPSTSTRALGDASCGAVGVQLVGDADGLPDADGAAEVGEAEGDDAVPDAESPDVREPQPARTTEPSSTPVVTAVIG